MEETQKTGESGRLEIVERQARVDNIVAGCFQRQALLKVLDLVVDGSALYFRWRHFLRFLDHIPGDVKRIHMPGTVVYSPAREPSQAAAQIEDLVALNRPDHRAQDRPLGSSIKSVLLARQIKVVFEERRIIIDGRALGHFAILRSSRIITILCPVLMCVEEVVELWGSATRRLLFQIH